MMRIYIVVHHSATKDGATASWGAIEQFHTSHRVGGRIVTEAEARAAKAAGDPSVEMPWADIGYHAGVELVGDRYYALMGRGVRETAAACRQADMNSIGLHVCCVGNYDLEAPGDEMLRVLAKRVVKPWMLQFGITPERVIGHRDAGTMEGLDWRRGQYKSCPGSKFDLDRLRALVR